MIIDPRTLSVRQTYELMTGCIMPRPIAFVSTISAEGVGNLAPFSYFTGITSTPPTLCFAPARKPDGSKKDTLINIEQTGEFVVNTVQEKLLRPMARTAQSFPPETDEFSEAGLTPVPSEKIKVPRVGESLISMECVLRQVVEVGAAAAGGGFLVIGEIVLFHVSPTVLNAAGEIDAQKMQPAGRLNGKNFILADHPFTLTD